MKEILIVDLKISLALAAFFAVYKLAFGNDTFFVRNRWFFLVAIVVSFTAPWLKFVNKVYVNIPSVDYSPEIINTSSTVTVAPFNIWSVVLNIILVVYLLGVLFYMTRFALAYRKVIRLIIKSEKKKFQELILVITRLSVTPFSLFKWLVVPKHQVDHPEFENIVQHESIHCRQYHSVDLFLAELMIVFQWFNPFAWWLKRSMVENHEFIVDREILQYGVDSRKYQYLLLNLSTGSNQLAGVNYFNTNLLKKRIRMINKTKSPRWYGLKNSMILISIVAIVALTATFETEVVAQNTDSEPMVVINGKKSDNKTLQSINPENIKVIQVLKDSTAISKYGPDGKHGIIEVYKLKDTLLDHSSKDAHGAIIVSHEGKVFVFNPQSRDSVLLSKKDYTTEKGIVVIRHSENKQKAVYSTAIQPAPGDRKPLFIVDGKIIPDFDFSNINIDNIDKIQVVGKEEANKYGEQGNDGVILITLKATKDKPISNSILFAPNPASGNVGVTLNGSNNTGMFDVKIYDKFGKLLSQDKKSGPTFTLSVSDFKADNYYVVASSGDNIYKGNLSVVH